MEITEILLEVCEAIFEFNKKNFNKYSLKKEVIFRKKVLKTIQDLPPNQVNKSNFNKSHLEQIRNFLIIKSLQNRM